MAVLEFIHHAISYFDQSSACKSLLLHYNPTGPKAKTKKLTPQ